jgi:hypothetical protein
MKVRLNFATIMIPASIVGIVVLCATIEEAGTDTIHYIEFARYTHLYMNGIETFWGYPGEYTLTILNKLSGPIANTAFGTNEPSIILAIAKIAAIMIGFIFLLISYKGKTKAWSRASSLFLILYFTSDIFMLGFLNSLRTGLGIFFISMFLSNLVGHISASPEMANISRPTKANSQQGKVLGALVIALAVTSHNSVFMVIIIYLFSAALMKAIERGQGLTTYSRHGRLYTAMLMLCSFSLCVMGGRIVQFRSMEQESASGIAAFKLLFDALVLLLAIARFMPIKFLSDETSSCSNHKIKTNSGAAFLLISASSLLGLCISTYGSETSNRIEQFLRITVYAIASIALSEKISRLNKNDWILICLLLISGLGIANLASPAVRANLA